MRLTRLFPAVRLPYGVSSAAGWPGLRAGSGCVLNRVVAASPRGQGPHAQPVFRAAPTPRRLAGYARRLAGYAGRLAGYAGRLAAGSRADPPGRPDAQP